MEPIETEYKGYRFRSRLEARWAVFFEAIGIEWKYEPEGFEFEDGTNYLPDFYLPDLEMWVEVKGGEPTEGEIQKAEKLSIGQKEDVLITVDDAKGGALGSDGPDHKIIVWIDEYLPEEELIDEVENHGAPADYMEKRIERGGFITTETVGFSNLPRALTNIFQVEYARLEEGADAMRSARFEHGEKGVAG